MTPSVDDLPAEERVSRYREMAEHTQALAARVENPTLREAYIELAGRWRALAESTMRSFDPKDDR
jgi:sirohydrochlorin ferrochelatase